MKIILTGSTGFLGGHLLESLSDYDVDVLSRNDLTEGCEWINRLSSCDVMIHCAARAHVMGEADAWQCYYESNVELTLKLAKAAISKGIKRFIFISSLKVNGEVTKRGKPFSSSDHRDPFDEYGKSKSMAEEKLFEVAKGSDLEIVVIRPPLIYGEGVKANFASLLKISGMGIPLPFGLIKNNRRSLVSVYNLVDLIKVCINHPSAAHQTLLVSDDRDLSTFEMVKLMAQVQNRSIYLMPVPVSLLRLLGQFAGKADVVDRLVGSLQVDIDYTKSILGWAPPMSVEEGFRRSVECNGSNKI